MGDPFLSLFKCGPHTHLIALLVYIFTTKVADVRVDKPVY